VFVPACEALREPRQIDGVQYHPLDVRDGQTPLETAQEFSRVAEQHLREFPPFDLLHLHEWMTGWVPPGNCPTVLSLGSIEATRRNGTAPDELSLAIAEAEREVAQATSCVLTPPWLRDRAVTDLGLDSGRVHAFPMEGRLPNEWEWPLDYGQVKKEMGLGPFDRLLLFVGPLEHAAGVDLLLEALPVLLQRMSNVRLVYVGGGNLYDHLRNRAGQMGVAHAVRLLGHVEGGQLVRLLRSAEALVLPSRWRVPQDDGVVDLARRAARPVITTHGGPAHLVRHEDNGLVTYDNPGSMVWAVDRLLGDPGHAQRMGQNGRREDNATCTWDHVAGHYLDLCARVFPELTEGQW
jgi:glycogen(starch) synthase